MNSKRRTGYGVFDLTRHVARRLQQEWEVVENPPRPSLRSGRSPARGELPLAFGLASDRSLRREKRPLAA